MRQQHEPDGPEQTLGAVSVDEEKFPVSVARVLHNRPELADLRAWAVGAAGLAVGAA